MTKRSYLAEFLQQNRAEVYKVSIFEYDKISKMNIGGDSDKIPQLENPMDKYSGFEENLCATKWHREVIMIALMIYRPSRRYQELEK